MSTEIPGQVYLCQVSETISCGACCGLYNIPHLSRPYLESLVQERTARFQSVPRTEDDLDDFALQELRSLGQDRPYPHFHHCPFLGLIGAHQSRVGCLLHPLIPENKGLDLRGYSYYGAAACRLYFCPGSYRLPDRYKRVVQAAAPNWYLYGLLITEHRLLKALFADLESRLGREITATDFQAGTSAAEHLQPLLELKETWPYRSARSPGPCHYLFEDGEYVRPGTRYPRMLSGKSRFSAILDELDSAFDSEQALRRAEAGLESLLASAAAALA